MIKKPTQLEEILTNLNRSYKALEIFKQDDVDISDDHFAKQTFNGYMEKYSKLLNDSLRREKDSLFKIDVDFKKEDDKYRFVDKFNQKNEKFPYIKENLPNVKITDEIDEGDQINYMLEYSFIFPNKSKNLFLNYKTKDSIKVDKNIIENFDNLKENSVKYFLKLYSK
ncbi:MAG: hypothetical protein ACOC3X_01880 [Nanoarchaeota archaeon]